VNEFQSLLNPFGEKRREWTTSSLDPAGCSWIWEPVPINFSRLWFRYDANLVEWQPSRRPKSNGKRSKNVSTWTFSES
jgi:hypothetical protein